MIQATEPDISSDFAASHIDMRVKLVLRKQGEGRIYVDPTARGANRRRAVS
jgi:hypothetical protein